MTVGESRSYHISLRSSAGNSETAGMTTRVDSAPADDSPNMVTIVDRRCEGLEKKSSHTLTWHIASSTLAKGTAPTVQRSKLAL